MKMSKFFSLSFYRDTLLRIRTLSIVLACILTVTAAIGASNYLMAEINAAITGVKITTVQTLTLMDVNSMMSSFVAIVIPVMTVQAFSFFMKRNESDFYEAVPVTRLAMAVSGMLAVLTSAVFAILASSVVSVLILIPCMGKSVSFMFGSSLLELFGLVIASILGISAATLAVSVTGTVRNAIVVTAVILAVPRTLMSMINTSLGFLNFSYVSGHIIPIFDNNYNILTALFSSNNKVFSNPWAYVYTFALALAYTVLAVFLIRRRKSEFATHPFANLIARHATGIAIATVISACGILLICLGIELVFVAVFLFMLAVGVYFIYQIVISRKEKNFLSALIAFPIFIGVNILITAIVIITNLAMSSYSPDADEIKSVSIMSEKNDEFSYITYPYADYVTLRSENLELEDDATKAAVAAALDRGSDIDRESNYRTVIFKIRAKQGTAYRRLYVTEEEMRAISSKLAKDEDYEKLWLNVAEGAKSPYTYAGGLELSEEASYRILDAMQAEVNELGFEKWYDICNSEVSVASIHYTVTMDGEDYSIYIELYESLPKTMAVYEDERRVAAEKALADIKDSINAAIDGSGEALYLTLSYFSKDSYYSIDTEITEGASDVKNMTDQLLPILTAENVDYEDAYVSVSLSGSSLFSESIYADFSVADGVTEEQLVSFFKTYGYEY